MTSGVKKYRERALRFNREEKSSRWIVNVECHRVVGNFIEGQTQGLAEDLGLEVSAVQNRAIAARTFIRLRKAFPDREQYRYISMARKMLSPSHFTVLGRAWEQAGDDMSNNAALSHLIDAAGSSMSVRAFRVHLDNEYKEGRVQEWLYRSARASVAVRKVLNTYGVPDEIRYAAREFLEVVEGGGSMPFVTLDRAVAVFMRLRMFPSPRRERALQRIEKILKGLSR